MKKLLRVNSQIELCEINISQAEGESMMRKGWNFDWSDLSNQNFRTIAAMSALGIEGLVSFEPRQNALSNFILLIELAPHNIGKNKRVADVAGILFAFVATESFRLGFQGYVFFESKTVLINYYIAHYGAQQTTQNRLYFDEETSVKLISRYLKKESDG